MPILYFPKRRIRPLELLKIFSKIAQRMVLAFLIKIKIFAWYMLKEFDELPQIVLPK